MNSSDLRHNFKNKIAKDFEQIEESNYRFQVRVHHSHTRTQIMVFTLTHAYTAPTRTHKYKSHTHASIRHRCMPTHTHSHTHTHTRTPPTHTHTHCFSMVKQTANFWTSSFSQNRFFQTTGLTSPEQTPSCFTCATSMAPPCSLPPGAPTRGQCGSFTCEVLS